MNNKVVFKRNQKLFVSLCLQVIYNLNSAKIINLYQVISSIEVNKTAIMKNMELVWLLYIVEVNDVLRGRHVNKTRIQSRLCGDYK